MIKRIKEHIFTIPQKIELLLLYGVLMFVLGISSNYYISNKDDSSDISRSDDKYYKVTSGNELISKESIAEPSVSTLRKEGVKVEPDNSSNEIAESKKFKLPTLKELQIVNQTVKLDPELMRYEGFVCTEDNVSGKGNKNDNVKSSKMSSAQKDINESSLKKLEQVITVKEGENFTKLMRKAGLDRKEIYRLGVKIDDIFPLKNLRPGQKIKIIFNELGDSLLFKELTIDFPLFIVSANKKASNGKFYATLIKKELNTKLIYKSGVIQESLYVFAKNNKVPMAIIPSLMDVFSYDIDFQRDIAKGTPVEILFEKLTDSNGKFVSYGKILYASIKINKDALKIYHFKYSNGLEYFKPDGSSVRRTLLKTPIDGAVISSHFGNRKHPILGYTKKHKGIDFAARKGTPLFAAGDGVITRIGRNGGYGNYIRIKHNNQYDTAYAHLSKFARNLKRGRRVKQGQIIAYVGSTGSSTGPHLHFEILKNNVQVNPLKVKSHKEKKIKGETFIKFKRRMGEINKILTNISQGS